jgi:hypothetical protein
MARLSLRSVAFLHCLSPVCVTMKLKVPQELPDSMILSMRVKSVTLVKRFLVRKVNSNLWIVCLTNRACGSLKVAGLINCYIGLHLAAWHTALQLAAI